MARIEPEVPTELASVPDDIRAAGWAVAVHNDYRLNGRDHTFWLFTREDPPGYTHLPGQGRYARGEGRTDAEALNEIRLQLGLPIRERTVARPLAPHALAEAVTEFEAIAVEVGSDATAFHRLVPAARRVYMRAASATPAGGVLPATAVAPFLEQISACSSHKLSSGYAADIAAHNQLLVHLRWYHRLVQVLTTHGVGAASQLCEAVRLAVTVGGSMNTVLEMWEPGS